MPEYAAYECDSQLPQPPADGELRAFLTSKLKEGEAALESAHRNVDLFGRVTDACRSALEQLNRNEPPQACGPTITNYR